MTALLEYIDVFLLNVKIMFSSYVPFMNQNLCLFSLNCISLWSDNIRTLLNHHYNYRDLF